MFELLTAELRLHSQSGDELLNLPARLNKCWIIHWGDDREDIPLADWVDDNLCAAGAREF